MDIAARNVLVHTNNLVKISDFGLVPPSLRPSRQTQSMNPETKTFVMTSNMRLAIRWMPREAIGKAPHVFSGQRPRRSH